MNNYQINIITLRYTAVVDTYINFHYSKYDIWLKLWKFTYNPSFFDSRVDYFKYINNKHRKNPNKLINLLRFIKDPSIDFSVNYFNNISGSPEEHKKGWRERKKQLIFSTNDANDYIKNINIIVDSLISICPDENFKKWRNSWLQSFLYEVHINTK